MERMEPGMRRVERTEAPLELVVGDNKVQAELIKLRWAREHLGNQSADDIMIMEWIDSGAAQKYREFVEKPEYQKDSVLMETAHLSKLLEQIDPKPPTLH